VSVGARPQDITPVRLSHSRRSDFHADGDGLLTRAPSSRRDQAARLLRVDRVAARGLRARPRRARATPARDGRDALPSVPATIPCAAPAISPIIRDAADMTPRTPATVAVTAWALMSAAPEMARTSTLRVIRSAPTTTISTPFSASTTTRGTTLVSTPPLIAVRRGRRRSAPCLGERERVRTLSIAMTMFLLPVVRHHDAITAQRRRHEV